jgi:hypothetical protein
MTDMERAFQAVRHRRAATTPIAAQYVLVITVVIIVGALALAEASGLLGTLIHSISFVA